MFWTSQTVLLFTITHILIISILLMIIYENLIQQFFFESANDQYCSHIEVIIGQKYWDDWISPYCLSLAGKQVETSESVPRKLHTITDPYIHHFLTVQTKTFCFYKMSARFFLGWRAFTSWSLNWLSGNLRMKARLGTVQPINGLAHDVLDSPHLFTYQKYEYKPSIHINTYWKWSRITSSCCIYFKCESIMWIRWYIQYVDRCV